MDAELLAAARVRLGETNAEQFRGGEGFEAVGIGVPYAAARERAELKVRALVPHDDADAVEGGVADGGAGWGRGSSELGLR
ncbi:hypothetical protein E0500_020285 [Streptomyces sp. KM273126]|uniref:hypothetical protein n=1 Tax=Streptomyces sp. KM273126 TaxID=2545247 RepID=UPI0015EBE5C5|nr:hypothetical protein [Streptomyces sp. KM273126]